MEKKKKHTLDLSRKRADELHEIAWALLGAKLTLQKAGLTMQIKKVRRRVNKVKS